MTNRVIIGQRGAAIGLWVSKPGIDVFSATERQLLLSHNSYSFQIIYSGFILLNTSLDGTLTIPDLGYKPWILCAASGDLELTYNSNTSISISGDTTSLPAATHYPPRSFYYFVTTQKIQD
jgi:hypothetical protein